MAATVVDGVVFAADDAPQAASTGTVKRNQTTRMVGAERSRVQVDRVLRGRAAALLVAVEWFDEKQCQ